MPDSTLKPPLLSEPQQQVLHLLMQLAPYEGGLITLIGDESAPLVAQFIRNAQPLWAVCNLSAPPVNAKLLLRAIAECYKIRISETDEIGEISVKLREFFRLSRQDSQHAVIVLEAAEALSLECIAALKELLDGADKADFCLILTSPHAAANWAMLTPYVSRTFDLAATHPNTLPSIPASGTPVRPSRLKLASLIVMGVLGLGVIGLVLLNKPPNEPLPAKPVPPVAVLPPPVVPPQPVPLTSDPLVPAEPAIAPPAIAPALPTPAKTQQKPKVVSKQEVVEAEFIHDADWLLAQPPSHYTIQIIALKKEKKFNAISASFRDSGAELARYPLLRNGAVLNALVYGIYEHQEEAQRIAADPALSVEGIKPWVRRLDEVHADIEKARRAEVHSQ